MQKLINYLNKNATRILVISVVVYIVLFSVICLWKYYDFQYNALDLAIYSQVFYNSSLGNLFEMTIHPHSYLGDHFEIFILALLPFYYLYKNPVSLLIFQTIILGLAAIPLGLIAKNIFKKNWALLLGVLILFSPFLQNTNTFEFHLLPFSIFFILWAFYFFQKNKFLPFIVLTLVSLTIREDVALIFLGLAILALFDKNKKKILWAVVPILISLIWFYISMKLMGNFSGYGEYKFLVYYSWLGETPLEMLKTVFTRPLYTLSNIFSLGDIKLLIFLFLSFAFLPFLKIRYLIPSVLIWAQLLLTASGTQTVIKTHYSALLIPWLFIASFYAIKSVTSQKNKYYKSIYAHKELYIAIALVVLVYSMLTLGPIVPFIKNLFAQDEFSAQERQLRQEMLEQIPDDASVVASLDIIPNLSSRENIYSLHYVYSGKKQFSDEPFVIENDIDYTFIDFHEIVNFQVSGKDDEDKFGTGGKNILDYLEDKQQNIFINNNDQVLFKKDYETTDNLYSVIDIPDLEINQEVKIVEVKKSVTEKEIQTKLSIFIQNPQEKRYLLRFFVEKDGQEIYSQFYPLAHGLYQGQSLTQKNIIQTNYKFILPDNIDLANHKIKIQPVKVTTGSVSVVNINSIDIQELEYEVLDNVINLN